MTYRVEISRRAAKAVTGLDKPVRARFGGDRRPGRRPPPDRMKELTARRPGVSEWGTTGIYEIHDQVLLVIVVDMGHRREDLVASAVPLPQAGRQDPHPSGRPGPGARAPGGLTDSGMTDIDPTSDIELHTADEHVIVRVPLAGPVTEE